MEIKCNGVLSQIANWNCMMCCLYSVIYLYIVLEVTYCQMSQFLHLQYVLSRTHMVYVGATHSVRGGVPTVSVSKIGLLSREFILFV